MLPIDVIFEKVKNRKIVLDVKLIPLSMQYD